MSSSARQQSPAYAQKVSSQRQQQGNDQYTHCPYDVDVLNSRAMSVASAAAQPQPQILAMMTSTVAHRRSISFEDSLSSGCQTPGPTTTTSSSGQHSPSASPSHCHSYRATPQPAPAAANGAVDQAFFTLPPAVVSAHHHHSSVGGNVHQQDLSGNLGFVQYSVLRAYTADSSSSPLQEVQHTLTFLASQIAATVWEDLGYRGWCPTQFFDCLFRYITLSSYPSVRCLRVEQVDEGSNKGFYVTVGSHDLNDLAAAGAWIRMMHKHFLMDKEGLWVARTAGEYYHLKNYLYVLKMRFPNHGSRHAALQHLPSTPIVLEITNNNKRTSCNHRYVKDTLLSMAQAHGWQMVEATESFFGHNQCNQRAKYANKCNRNNNFVAQH